MDPAKYFHHIVLVSEWDTIYARTLEQEFFKIYKDAIPAPPGGQKPDNTSIIPPRWFSYLRGIDGKLSTAVDGSPAEKPPENDTSAANSAKSFAQPMEAPNGRNQLDYLRRLTVELEDYDRQLKSADDGTGIIAIGVLGTDVYDKLLVLQALRREFPGILFFTTDLDARLAYPAEAKWSHNLVVASSFGYTLRSDLQQNIPPFRDTYQTAAFYTMLKALQPEFHQNDNLGSPRLFEISRTGPYDLGVSPPKDDIHPAPSHIIATQTTRWEPRILLGVLLLILLAYQIPPLKRVLLLPLCINQLKLLALAYASPPSEAPAVPTQNARTPMLCKPEQIEIERTLSILILSLIYIGCFAFLLYRALRDNQNGSGEPLEWVLGVSIWPTEFIRSFAIFLAAAFLIWGCFDLKLDRCGIESDFKLSGNPQFPWTSFWKYLSISSWKFELPVGIEQSKCAQPADPLSSPNAPEAFAIPLTSQTAPPDLAEEHSNAPSSDLWREFLLWQVGGYPSSSPEAFAVPLHGHLVPVKAKIESGDVDAKKLWREFLVWQHGGLRFLRATACTIVAFFLCRFIFAFFGKPIVPYRGARSYHVDFIMIWSLAVILLFLTFAVVDATKLCTRLVQHLSSGDTVWPHDPQRVKKFGAAHKEDIRQILDLELIARRSATVSRFIYYRFVILFLIVISRIHFFANWEWPVALVLVICFILLYALISSLQLRTAAEQARKRSVDRLTTNLLRTHDPRRRRAIKLMLKNAEEFSEGAFAPFYKQPVIGSILIPWAGVGSAFILEFLTRSR